jgi:hypothetical protein
MITCNFCGNPIKNGYVMCNRCAAKSFDPFYQKLGTYYYTKPVDARGHPV